MSQMDMEDNILGRKDTRGACVLGTSRSVLGTFKEKQESQWGWNTVNKGESSRR